MRSKKLLTRYWIHVFMYSCITILLTSCAEQQLVMNPESTDTQEISTSVTSLMKSSGSLLEGAEVKKENGKTIIKPKKKITLKEFLASQPYKFKVDNSVMQPKSAPCNWRWNTYSVLDKYDSLPNKSIGFMIPSNSEVSWNNLKTNYGFSRILINPEDFSTATSAGYSPYQMIINLPSPPSIDQYSNVQAIINNSAYCGVAGFLIDEPLERNLYSPLGLISLISSTTRTIFVSSYAGTIYGDMTVDNYSMVKSYCDNMFLMSDLYYHWCGTNRSPSDLWSLFHNTWYSGHNTSNFLHIDHQYPGIDNCYSKWSGLFPLANTLNLSSLFLYSDRSYNLINGLNSFCTYGFYNGWLRGYAQHVTFYERCDSPNCEHCQDPETPEGQQYWFLDHIVYHEDWYELFP